MEEEFNTKSEPILGSLWLWLLINMLLVMILTSLAIGYNQLVINDDQEYYTYASVIDTTLTQGQQNALDEAESLLTVMGSSYSYLIEYLEYIGYTTEDATFAADNCGADWFEQAAKRAQIYIDAMEFTREDLIGQLEYEGFTYEQAVYGVEAVGY